MQCDHLRATWIQFRYSGRKDTTHNNSGHMNLKCLQILQNKILFTLQFLFNIILIKFIMCYHKMNICIICKPIIILHALARAVSRWLLTEEARIQFRASPWGIYGGQSGTGTSFSLSQFSQSIILQMFHTHTHSSAIMIYNLSKCQCHEIVHFSLSLIQSPFHCVYTSYQLCYHLYQNTMWYIH